MPHAGQRTLHLALLVLELVTNAIKHAHPAGVPRIIEVNAGAMVA